MRFILTVVGVVLIFEGMPWFLSPNGVRRMLLELARMPEGSLRLFGLACMLSGLVLVYWTTL